MVSLANSVITILAQAEGGRWTSIVGRDGRAIMTFDPPIGFQFPLKIGKGWATTHRVTKVATGRTIELNCKAPGSEDAIWYGPDYGFWLKANMGRLGDRPQGPGTQEHEVVADLVK